MPTKIPFYVAAVVKPLLPSFSLLSSFFKGCVTEGIRGLPSYLQRSFEHGSHMVSVDKFRVLFALILG
jgi:hypothetical protein